MPLGALANLPMNFGMLGFACADATTGAPLVREYTVISSSAIIRPGDPVVLLQSGKIRRATPSDAVLLGFAAKPSSYTGYMGGQFPFAPILTDNRLMANDGSSDKRITVYIANGKTIFSSLTKGTSAASNRGGTYDLAYMLTSPTPTITMGGTTGSTTYTYKVVPVNTTGPAAAGTAGTTTTGNSTLSSTNYNIITWAAQTGAVEYEVWKLNGSTYELLAVVDGGTVTTNDTGQTTSTARSIPATNYSGFVMTFAATAVDIVQALDPVIENPNDTVATTGLKWNFQIPASMRQFDGAAALSS